ncbi:hypothetical protein J2T17_001769 [Paenibacillus mucilaginosus]|uniref:hypothetical protein n=1 Tax=Paenibacillus mucilaginosus TaxID=61624 RepID=UPI003D24DC14
MPNRIPSGSNSRSRIAVSYEPVQLAGLESVVSVAAGDNFNLALTKDGNVWAWGNNARGQLGDGTKENRSTPVQVRGIAGVRSIAAGKNHSLALLKNGTLWSWGSNEFGQLATSAAEAVMPQQIPYIDGVQMITAGHDHSAAVNGQGMVYLWGKNYSGQLGDGTTGHKLVPAQALKVNHTAVEAEGLELLPSEGSIGMYEDSAASGGRAVGYIDNYGDNLQFYNHYIPGKIIRVRYAALNSGTMNLYINGAYAQSVSFDSTGAWTDGTPLS